MRKQQCFCARVGFATSVFLCSQSGGLAHCLAQRGTMQRQRPGFLRFLSSVESVKAVALPRSRNPQRAVVGPLCVRASSKGGSFIRRRLLITTVIIASHRASFNFFQPPIASLEQSGGGRGQRAS